MTKTPHNKPISTTVNTRIPEKFDRNSLIYSLHLQTKPKLSFDEIATIVSKRYNEPKMTRSRVWKIITTYIRLKKFNRVKPYKRVGVNK